MSGLAESQPRASRHRLALDDPESLSLFRGLLASARYTQEDIRRAIQTDSMESVAVTDLHLIQRMLPREGLLPALLRLFLCSLTADPAALARLIHPMTPERLASLGLIRLGPGGAEPVVRLIPVNNLVLVTEFFPEDVANLAPDFVLGPNPTSKALASILIRKPFKSALDLGSGNGIQTILTSQHCGRVVATDINPRAVNFTAFNCLLNGITNVECREGSLFEPVAKETFDLILCNPPFVVSPDNEYQFRDSGQPLDTFCQNLVRGLPRHLNEGGFGEILCSWVLREGEDWPSPPLAWVEGSGCDAFVFHTATESPLGYASMWNQPLAKLHLREFGAALDRWSEHFARSKVRGIASGGIVLRRRSGGANWFAPMDVLTERDSRTGDHVWRMFDARDWQATATEADFLAARFLPAPDAQLDQAMNVKDGRLAPSGMWASLTAGFRFRGEIDVVTARLLTQLDGKRTLGELIETLRPSIEAPPEEIRTKVIAAVRSFHLSGLVLLGTS